MRRVGGTRLLPLNARLVASAGPDLPRRARAGTFREDLFYRLAVVTVSLPPLVERREDLLPAARALAKAGGGPAAFTAAARRVILGHAWRGNFRELENVVRRAASEALAEGARAIDAAHLKLASPSDPEALLHAASHARWSLRELADAYIALILDEAGGNVTEAARRLGVARKTLYARRTGS
jgi:DNA-binding NtrC family response regulator